MKQPQYKNFMADLESMSASDEVKDIETAISQLELISDQARYYITLLKKELNS